MDTLETRISEQLEKTNATPLSVSKEDALTMLSLIADERGHIRNEAAAAMRTLRKQFPLAMYEQAVKFASNGEFRIDGEIGDDEIRGLALIAGIEYPAESVMETPPSSTAGDSAAPLPGRKPKVVPPKPRIRNTEKQRGGPNQNEADYAAVRDVFLNSIELVPNHSDASETYDRIMFAVDWFVLWRRDDRARIEAVNIIRKRSEAAGEEYPAFVGACRTIIKFLETVRFENPAQ